MSFLPGMFPAGVMASEKKLTTLDQVASATSTGETITGPANIQAGDLLVLWDRAIFGGSDVPAGFTIIGNESDGAARQILSLKVADGSEANAALSGMAGFGPITPAKALYVFRGDVPIISAAAQDSDIVVLSSSNPAAQVVNASGGVAPLVVIAGYGTEGSVNPRSFSPAKDGEISPNGNLFLAYKIYNSAPADVTVDMSDEGDGNALASCYIECT